MEFQIEHEFFKEIEKSNKLERDKNGNAHIQKPEGTYTVLYGTHLDSVELEKQLPGSPDGFFLETGHFDYIREPVESFRSSVPDPEYLKKHNIPVYCGDTLLNVSAIVIDKAVVIGEFTAATVIGRELISEVKKLGERKMNRRGFLKLGAKGAAGVYLSSPLVSSLSRFVPELTGHGHNTTAEYAKMSQKLHPETNLFLYTLRNVVMAHKQQWLMEHMKNKSHLATLLGAAHVGIEDEIMHTPEDRLEFLRTLSKAGILKKVIQNPETLYKVVQFDFDQGQKSWLYKEIEIPELKELLENVENDQQ